MTRLLGLIGLSTMVFGQSVTLSLGSAPGTAGGSVAVPIRLASSGGAQVAGLQFSFSYSSDITGVTVAIGSAAGSAQKSISCGGNTCLIYGINQNIIADGPVATATFQVASSPSTLTIPIQLTGAVAANAGGNAIPATATAGTISLVTPPVLTGLSCAAGVLATPGSAPCTVSLTSAAPAGGFAILLSSNNANLTAPSGVTVAAGQTTASFNATAIQVSADQTAVVTASSGGVTLTAMLNLVAPVQLTSLACLPAALTINASGMCTVSLNKATANAILLLVSSNNAVAAVPSSVTVPAGQSSATFQVTSGSIAGSQSAIITASFNGYSQSVTLIVSAPVLTAVSVTPSGSSGMSQTFSFVFSDSQSTANLSAAAMLIAPSLAYASSCLVVYGASQGTIQLEWDNVAGADEKPIASTAILQNSQCTIGAASVTTTGLSITITLAITFKSAFSGPKNIYMYGADTGGAINTGWVRRGTYSVNTVSAPVPSAVSVTPSAGSGSSQTFSFVFSDSQSAANLSAAAILIAPSLTYASSCLVVYGASQGTIQLEWDSVAGASVKPVASTTVLQNSQCKIGATSVTTSGLSTIITIAITFNSAFSGPKNIYMYGADTGSATNTGWVQLGTYSVNTVSAPVPTADSVTPSGGIGLSQTFSFVFSDSQSAANLSAAAILIAPSLVYANSCLVVYDRNLGTIQLEWDNVTGADEKPLASATILQNSQCAIGAASVTTSGLSNIITIAITFNSAFSGLKNIYMYGADTDGTINTGWVQKGTWTPF